MASRCVYTGLIFDLTETKILSHANSWTARLFKEAWLSKKLQQAFSVWREAIKKPSMTTVGGEVNVTYSRFFCKNLPLVLTTDYTCRLTTKSPCSKTSLCQAMWHRRRFDARLIILVALIQLIIMSSPCDVL